jgi:hypothetical protein
MPGRCCVFQPFDNGPHEKRYSDIIEPAILAADLEPYRVDRDDEALVPIDTLHDEIRACAVCLADISTANPNVMYEIGAAIGGGKDVLMISSTGAAKFPFDIRHRTVIEYTQDSTSDFEKLKSEITKRLKAIVKKQGEIQEIVSASPVKSTEGLKPQEMAALALVMAGRDDAGDGVAPSAIRDDMDRAGFTRLATGLALASLARQGLLEATYALGGDFDDSSYAVYTLTETGEDWLLNNQDRFELRSEPKPQRQRTPSPRLPQALSASGVGDDDVPF